MHMRGIAVSALILSLATSAFGATRTWTGTSSGLWSAAANWGGTAPVPGDDLLFPSGASERWLYEDDGNGFDYQRGGFVRRRFAARADGSTTVVEIGAPEGTYRPQARSMLLTVRTQADAARVTIGGVSLDRTPDLDKAERGWTTKDGSLTIKLPDRFERMEIRIER